VVAAGAPDALLTVDGKPLILQPLKMLLAAGIRRILIASATADAPRIQRFLGGGATWRANLSYLHLPPAPCDLAAAVVLGGEFVGRRAVAVARAGQVIAGRGLEAQLQDAAQLKKGALVFVCRADSVTDVADAEARPGLAPGQDYAGLFFYDHTAAARANALASESPDTPDIDALHRAYLDDGRLRVEEFAPAVTVRRIAAESRPAAGRAVADCCETAQ